MYFNLKKEKKAAQKILLVLFFFTENGTAQQNVALATSRFNHLCMSKS